MKKIISALLVTAAVAAPAVAANNIQTGFYVGANAGASASKLDIAISGIPTQNIGAQNAVLGLYTGYGVVNSNLYFGGELFAAIDNTKFKVGTLQVKRKAFFGAAARLGFLVSPSTMIYGRLGLEFGKWQASDNGVNQGRTNKAAFAPGLGLETALTNNLSLRTEWVYQINKAFANTKTTNVRTRAQRFTVGISYRF